MFAYAAAVDPTTFITKVITASASHVVAAICFLDPLLATSALFELFTFYEFFKLVVQTTELVTYLIFCAGLAGVELYSAVEAVMFFTTLAMQFSVFIEDKRELAVRSRTPRNVLRGSSVIKSTLIENAHFCLIKDRTKNSWRHFALTLVLWTFQRKS